MKTDNFIKNNKILFFYDKTNGKSDFESEGNVFVSKERHRAGNLKYVNQFQFTTSHTERSQKKDMKIMLQKIDHFCCVL